MIPITEIAQKLGIDQQMLIPYGKYKAKIMSATEIGQLNILLL